MRISHNPFQLPRMAAGCLKMPERINPPKVPLLIPFKHFRSKCANWRESHVNRIDSQRLTQ